MDHTHEYYDFYRLKLMDTIATIDSYSWIPWSLCTQTHGYHESYVLKLKLDLSMVFMDLVYRR